MVSTFGTYSVAYTGMYVSQAGLTASTNNLSNVSTTGASRVRVAGADESVCLSDNTSVTNGASVASITRARDILLDAAYRTQNADSSYWAVKSGDLEYMQEILSEFTAEDGTSDDGVQELISDYFSSWEELSKDPTSTSCRQAVTEAAVSLISGLSELDGQLQSLQLDAVNGVKDGVDSLNTLAQQVADLNAQIKTAELTGEEASYLRDQRDALLDQMSSLADISVNEDSSGLTVTIGGSTFITGDVARKLVSAGDGSTANPLTVRWADTGNKAGITSGSIKAYLEDAGQSGYETIDSSDIPYDFSTGASSSITTLRQALNDLVTTLATEINSLATGGIDLDGNTGVAFFTQVDTSKPLSITNIQVNDELLDDPDKVVASGSTASGDNSVADAVCALSGDKIFKFGGLEMDTTDFYQSVISWIGTAGDNAASSYETKAALVSQVETQRQSVSSISMDEEMSNLIIYQNAYNASTRVLSTIDGLIGDLIEDLG